MEGLRSWAGMERRKEGKGKGTCRDVRSWRQVSIMLTTPSGSYKSYLHGVLCSPWNLSHPPPIELPVLFAFLNKETEANEAGYPAPVTQWNSTAAGLGGVKPRDRPTVLEQEEEVSTMVQLAKNVSSVLPGHFFLLLVFMPVIFWAKKDRENDQASVTSSHPCTFHSDAQDSHNEKQEGALVALTPRPLSQAAAIAPSILEPHHFPKPSLHSGQPLFFFSAEVGTQSISVNIGSKIYPSRSHLTQTLTEISKDPWWFCQQCAWTPSDFPFLTLTFFQQDTGHSPPGVQHLIWIKLLPQPWAFPHCLIELILFGSAHACPSPMALIFQGALYSLLL